MSLQFFLLSALFSFFLSLLDINGTLLYERVRLRCFAARYIVRPCVVVSKSNLPEELSGNDDERRLMPPKYGSVAA